METDITKHCLPVDEAAEDADVAYLCAKYDWIHRRAALSAADLDIYNADDEPWLRDGAQVAGWVKARSAMARLDAEEYCDLALAVEGHSIQPHGVHHLMHESLRLCVKAGQHCTLVLPPEHGKTSQIAKFLVWMLGHNPRLRIGLVSGDEDLAKRNMIAIRKTLCAPLTRIVFPELVPDTRASRTGGEWSKTRLYLEGMSYPAFEVFPRGGMVEGVRLDLVWMDDVVTRKCHRSEAERIEAKSAIHNTFLRRLTDKGIAIITNNCWHREDPIHQMLQSPSFTVLWVGYVGTDSIYWRIHHPPEGWEIKTEGDLHRWEAVWPKARLDKVFLEDSLSYKRLYNQRAMLAEEARFGAHEDWHTYEPQDLPSAADGARVFAFLDPAGGRMVRHNDFAAISLVAIGFNRQLYLLDCWLARAVPEDQARMLWIMHRRAKELGYPEGIHTAAVEMLPKDEGWMHGPIEAVQREIKAQGDPDWKLNWIVKNPPTGMHKHTKIERYNSHVLRGWIKFPAGFEQLQYQAGAVGESWKQMIAQLEDFPPDAQGHDDGPDSLTGAIELAEGIGPALVPELERNAAEIRLKMRRDERNNLLVKRDIDGAPQRKRLRRPLA